MDQPNGLESAAVAFLSNSNSIYEECAHGIAVLDRIIVGAPSTIKETRSYLLPALYSFWERFFSLVFSEYLRCLSLSNLKLDFFKDCFVEAVVANHLHRFATEKKVYRIQELTSVLGIHSIKAFHIQGAAKFELPLSFDDPISWIETKSNVSFEVLKQHCVQFDINLESIKAKLRESNFELYPMLKEFVEKRNSIAHGDGFDWVSLDEWERFSDRLPEIWAVSSLAHSVS